VPRASRVAHDHLHRFLAGLLTGAPGRRTFIETLFGIVERFSD
jgi:hypothetical protein